MAGATRACPHRINRLQCGGGFTIIINIEYFIPETYTTHGNHATSASPFSKIRYRIEPDKTTPSGNSYAAVRVSKYWPKSIYIGSEMPWISPSIVNREGVTSNRAVEYHPICWMCAGVVHFGSEMASSPQSGSLRTLQKVSDPPHMWPLWAAFDRKIHRLRLSIPYGHTGEMSHTISDFRDDHQILLYSYARMSALQLL